MAWEPILSQWFNNELVSSVQDDLVHLILAYLAHLIVTHLVDLILAHLVHPTDRNSPGFPDPSSPGSPDPNSPGSPDLSSPDHGSPDPGSPGYEAAPRVLAPPSCCLFVTSLFSDRHRLNNQHHSKIRIIFKNSIIFKITMIVTFFVFKIFSLI